MARPAADHRYTPLQLHRGGTGREFPAAEDRQHFREKAKKIELGNLDVWRDFSDVRSLVAAFRGLLEAKPYGEFVNVSSGKTYSLREVIDMCAPSPGMI